MLIRALLGVCEEVGTDTVERDRREEKMNEKDFHAKETEIVEIVNSTPLTTSVSYV